MKLVKKTLDTDSVHSRFILILLALVIIYLLFIVKEGQVFTSKYWRIVDRQFVNALLKEIIQNPKLMY